MLIDRGATVDLQSACGLGMIERIERFLRDRPQSFGDHASDAIYEVQLLVEHGDDVNRNLKKVAYFGWEDDAIDQDYTALESHPHGIDLGL